MFTVKATYRSETRKFSFQESSFPTFQALYDQLYRVFPISHNYYLSRLLFSSSGDSHSRILIGMEAHSAEEYEAHIAPYRTKDWPGALLRFSVFDETPHKVPSGVGSVHDDAIADDGPTATGGEGAGPQTPASRLRSILSNAPSHGHEHNHHHHHGHHRHLPLPPHIHHHGHRHRPNHLFGPPSPPHFPPFFPSMQAHPPPPPPPFSYRPFSPEGPNVNVHPPTPSMPRSPPPRPPPFGHAPPPPPPTPSRLRPVASMPAMSARWSPVPPPPPPPPPSHHHPRPPPPPHHHMHPSPFPHHAPPHAPSPPPNQGHPLPPPPPPPPPRPPMQQSSWSPFVDCSHLREPRANVGMSSNRHSWAGPSDIFDDWKFDSFTAFNPYKGSFETNAEDVKQKIAEARERATRQSAWRSYTDAVEDLRNLPIFGAPKAPDIMPDWNANDDWTPPSPTWAPRLPSWRKPKVRFGTTPSVPEVEERDSGMNVDGEGKYRESDVAKGMDVDSRSTTPNEVKVKSHSPYTPYQDELSILDTPPAPDATRVLSPVAAELPALSEPLRKFLTDLTKFRDEFTNSHDDFKRSLDMLQDSTQVLRASMATQASPAVSPVVSQGPATLPAVEEPASADDAPLPVHTNIRCDMCDQTIVGVRHKCLDCPDYDLCSPCLTQARATKKSAPVTMMNVGGRQAEAQLLSGHQSSHMFFAIEEPGDLWLHTAFDSNETCAPFPQAQPQPQPRDDTTGVAVEELAPALVHGATCNLCDTTIVGPRFKCLVCPDWDACSSCFSIVAAHHPDHGFLRADTPAALQHYTTLHLSSSPKPTHNARCDHCNNTIRGTRYKCMHLACRDYDLCEDCEALPLPVHNPMHPMLKIRKPQVSIPKVHRYGDELLFAYPPSTLSSSAPKAETPVPAPQSPSPQPEPEINHRSPDLYADMPDLLPWTEKELEETDSVKEQEDDEKENYPPFMPRFEPVVPSPPSSPNVASPMSMPGALMPVVESFQSLPLRPVEVTMDMPSPLSVTQILGAALDAPAAQPLAPSPPAPEVMWSRRPVCRLPTLRRVPSETVPQPAQSNVPEIERRPEVEPEVVYDVCTPPTQEEPVPARISSPASYTSFPSAIPDAVATSPRRVASPEPLIRLDDDQESHVGSTLQGSDDGTGTSSGATRPSLPRLPPTDFHELFDMTSHFRHFFTLPSSVGTRTPPVALVPKVVKAERAETVSDVSPPTELASTNEENSSPAPAVPSLPPPPANLTRAAFMSPGRAVSDAFRRPPPPSSQATSSRPVSMVTDGTSTVVPDTLPLTPTPLRATFVRDNNIPDGQVFPPGAEFVKSWSMRNDGISSWPPTTELVFVAGDRLMLEKQERFKVGMAYPGEEVDVWTGEMKAPDVPGKYISYWRLSDGLGNRFGHSIWVDITVAEPGNASRKDDSSDGSLASSSVIIMPGAAASVSQTLRSRSGTGASAAASRIPAQDETSTVRSDDDVSSSVSFLDVPSDEEDVFEDSRSHLGSTPMVQGERSPDVEYVVLYDSSDEEGL